MKALRNHGCASCPAAPDASSARRARHLRVPHGRNRVLGRLSWWPSASRAQEAQLDALIPPDDTCLRTWETSAVAVRKSWSSSDGGLRFGAVPPDRLPLPELSMRHQRVLRLTSMCRRSPVLRSNFDRTSSTRSWRDLPFCGRTVPPTRPPKRAWPRDGRILRPADRKPTVAVWAACGRR